MAAKRNKRLPLVEIQVNDTPFVGINTARSVGGQRALFVAVLGVGDAYLGIEYQMGLNQVVLCVAKKGNFPHFYNITQDDLSATVADLKSKAITGGATLEAIQLLKELTELTTAEEAEMANPKAAAAAKTKLTKKSEPVAKEPKAAKEKGAGRVPAEFAYKSVKGVENTARAGTWTHHMVETIVAHTSTADARAANAKAKGATPKGENFSDKALDFAWAKAKGYITY